MRSLIAALLLSLAASSRLDAACQSVTITQYAYTLGAPLSGGGPGSITYFQGGQYPAGTVYHPILGQGFDYLVPAGYVLRIKSALFASKNLGAGVPGQMRSSYAEVFVSAPAAPAAVQGGPGVAVAGSGTSGPLISVPEQAANPRFDPGIEVPAGYLVYGFFINNSPWDEVMGLVLNGSLCPVPPPL